MADLEHVWHYTRTYMMSDRTNPDPVSFISDLRSLGLTSQEKAWLIQQVSGWPGGNPEVTSATIQDIQQV
jgi:hypothetical protein